MATGHTLTTQHAETIVDNADVYVQFMQDAVAKYAASVRTDIALMRTFQNDYPRYYAMWSCVAAIMSNGMDLEQSFYAGHGIVAAMLDNPVMEVDYDIVNLIIKSVAPSAGSPAYGGSVRSLVKEWARISAWLPEMMTYSSVRSLAGMGPKTCMWALALWNHHNHVFTLDRWMLRGIAGFIGGGAVSISENSLHMIAEMMLDIAEMLNVEPLVAQWSMWNVYRGDTHADHSAAVPEWYRDALAYYTIA